MHQALTAGVCAAFCADRKDDPPLNQAGARNRVLILAEMCRLFLSGKDGIFIYALFLGRLCVCVRVCMCECVCVYV